MKKKMIGTHNRKVTSVVEGSMVKDGVSKYASK